MFYHIKNLQSTKTNLIYQVASDCFITLRIYKVLKPAVHASTSLSCFITLRIYKVLKHALVPILLISSFITLRIYKVLKQMI